jgi:hypothetical protein
MHELLEYPTAKRKATAQQNAIPLEEILDDFFSSHSARQVNKDLWNWYVTAIASPDMDHWTAIERSNLAMFYRRLTELLIKLEQFHENLQPKP